MPTHEKELTRLRKLWDSEGAGTGKFFPAYRPTRTKFVRKHWNDFPRAVLYEFAATAGHSAVFDAVAAEMESR